MTSAEKGREGSKNNPEYNISFEEGGECGRHLWKTPKLPALMILQAMLQFSW